MSLFHEFVSKWDASACWSPCHCFRPSSFSSSFWPAARPSFAVSTPDHHVPVLWSKRESSFLPSYLHRRFSNEDPPSSNSGKAPPDRSIESLLHAVRSTCATFTALRPEAEVVQKLATVSRTEEKLSFGLYLVIRFLCGRFILVVGLWAFCLDQWTHGFSTEETDCQPNSVRAKGRRREEPVKKAWR